jgi:hypothetical protein
MKDKKKGILRIPIGNGIPVASAGGLQRRDSDSRKSSALFGTFKCFNLFSALPFLNTY